MVSVNWLSPVKERVLSINASLGMARLDFIAQTLTVYTNQECTSVAAEINAHAGKQEGEWVIEVNQQEPLQQEWAAFIQAIQGDDHQIVSGESARTALELVLDVSQTNE